MNADKIIYFYFMRGKAAKRFPWSSIQFDCLKTSARECELLCCGIPEYYMGQREWNSEKLTKILSEKLEEGKADSYYLHPELNCRIDLKEKRPPDSLLKLLFRQNNCWENLYLIGIRQSRQAEKDFTEEYEEQAEFCGRLFGEYFSRINRITIVTDCPQAYEWLSDYVYEEYGIPTAYVRRLEDNVKDSMVNTAGKRSRTVIVDMRKQYRIPCSMVPSGSVYIDFYSEKEKRFALESKRKDIQYLSVVKFLDTITKNGYNTIVNRTNSLG